MIPAQQATSAIEPARRRLTPTSDPRPGLVTLIMLFAAANLAAPTVTKNANNEVLAAVLVGGLISEVILLAIWAAFGIEETGRRLGRVGFLYAIGCFTWLVGLRIPHNRPMPFIEGVMFTIAAVVFMSLAIGAGFLYRSQTGKTLCYCDRFYRRPGPVFQFSIRQILGWTTGVALALMMSRLVFDMKFGDIGSFKGLPMVIGLALFYCVQILIVAGACLELGLGRGLTIRSFGVLVLVLLVVSVASTMVMIFISSLTPRPPVTELAGGIFLFFLGLSITTTLALTRVRRIGYRLVRIQD